MKNAILLLLLCVGSVTAKPQVICAQAQDHIRSYCAGLQEGVEKRWQSLSPATQQSTDRLTITVISGNRRLCLRLQHADGKNYLLSLKPVPENLKKARHAGAQDASFVLK